jgi:flagellar biosynthetic protein FlhB
MSDNEQDKDQKEFEATEQRRRDARRDGDVVQSKELNAFALTLGSLLLIPLALISLSILLQQSFVVSGKRIKPDIKKISPVSNFKKKYGKEGMTEFLKDAAKMLFAGAISTFFLWQFAQEYYASSAVQLGQFVDFTFSQVVNLIICFAAFQFCLAVVDFPLQRNLHAERIKMSREDLKKETKQSEGDPQLKQSRRQKAIQISKNDMLKQVETATVIMVNPTHYAVALRWDRDGGRAPVCVAKGVDNMAARIRELAIQHSVPIYSDPPSTRAIYKNVDIDEEIQDQHFGAVAAAIQFVEAIQLRD